MEAKRISQKFETGKRTNLKRAVSECVYDSRLYYNTELQSDSVVDDLDKEPLLKEIKQSGVITEDQIQTLKKRSNDLRRNVINYNWIEHAGNGYGIPLTEEQGAKELDWIKSFVGKNIYRYKDIEVIQNASPSDLVFKGFYNNGVGSWCNYLPIYVINGIEYVPMSKPYIIGRYE